MDTADASNTPGDGPIIAAWDGTSRARDAVALAGTLARELDAPVHIVQVGPLHVGFADFEPAFEYDLARQLEDAPMKQLEGIEHDKHLIPGRSPAEGLHRAIAEYGASLVVLGSTHRGAVGRLLPGTVAGHLLHGSPCAVAIAPRGYADAAPDALRTIAVAYDGSPEARAAVTRATDMALRSSGTLRVIDVVAPPNYGWAGSGVAMYPPPETNDDARERSRNDLNELLEQLPPAIRADGRLLDGQPVLKIMDECAKGVDLLVMGSRGYGTVGRVLLGSVSSGVIKDAPCPVIVLPQSATHGETQHGSRETESVA